MTPDRVRRPLVTVAVGLAAALLLAGVALGNESPAPVASGSPSPAGSPSPTGSGAPAPSGATPVSIVKKTFQPAGVTIHAGDAVRWTVTDGIGEPHSVTSGTPQDSKPGTVFDSGIGLKSNGDSFSWTFTSAGTFAYFCAVHPDTMRGTVTVLEAAAAGGAEDSVPTSSKLIAVGVVAVALVILLGWARLYRRMNPAP